MSKQLRRKIALRRVTQAQRRHLGQAYAAGLQARAEGRRDPRLESWVTRFLREGRKFGYRPPLPLAL